MYWLIMVLDFKFYRTSTAEARLGIMIAARLGLGLGWNFNVNRDSLDVCNPESS